MSIELLPFSAFALESCAAPAPAPGEGQTLTLPLRAARAAPEPMRGLLSLAAPGHAPEGGHQVGIVAPAETAAFTITF